jgi:ABC-2 type transport system ATP-binding protein
MFPQMSYAEAHDPTTDSSYAVAAYDLVKTYKKDIRALDGLTVEVRPGEIFALLGPNGAGKSTAIKILTTLTRPDSGRALVAGHDVRRHPDRVRRAIGVVAQRSGADPLATGRENLTLQGHLYGMGGSGLRQRVAELLTRFDLNEAADRAVRTYSGGMVRRLDVALGLVHRPEVLVLDEPTTGLDPEARAALWEEISQLAGMELAGGGGLAILLTTHYLEEADHLAGRLALIDKGKVISSGTPDEMKNQLHGDAVHVELQTVPRPADQSAVREALAGLPGIHEISVEGRRLSARADDGPAAVPAVLAALDRARVPVGAVTVARPSLDDVYLRLVGRRFAEADAKAEAEPIVTGGTR